MPRRRPLHTCTASCLAMAHKAWTRLQDLEGPLGSTANRVVSFSKTFIPFLHAVIYHLLALLSIIDDHILTVENKIEFFFPRSAFAFDKVDLLVCRAEALPHQLDDVITKLPGMMHQFPLLDSILVHLISWLNFLLSILTHWGSNNAREKEITVDVNCSDTNTIRTVSEENTNAERNPTEDPKPVQEHGNESANQSKVVPSEVIHLSVKRLHSWKSRIKALEEPLYAGDSPMYSSYLSANTSPVSDSSQDEIGPANQTGKADTMNCTYKEILEKGMEEEDGNAVEEHKEQVLENY